LLSLGAGYFVFQFAVQKCNELWIKKKLILLFDVYGCGTWSLTLREESRLGVFKDRVPKKVFGRKREEITGN
jgi:hypothetical protein